LVDAFYGKERVPMGTEQKQRKPQRPRRSFTDEFKASAVALVLLTTTTMAWCFNSSTLSTKSDQAQRGGGRRKRVSTCFNCAPSRSATAGVPGSLWRSEKFASRRMSDQLFRTRATPRLRRTVPVADGSMLVDRSKTDAGALDENALSSRPGGGDV
jgi:hypothetical protein